MIIRRPSVNPISIRSPESLATQLGRSWTVSVKAGVYQAEVEGLQQVAVDPVITALLGVTTTVQTFYQKSIFPQWDGNLTAGSSAPICRFSISSGVSAGNGVYLTSRAQTGTGSFSYTATRKWSFSANGGYSRLDGIGQNLQPYLSGHRRRGRHLRPHRSDPPDCPVRCPPSGNRRRRRIAGPVIAPPSGFPSARAISRSPSTNSRRGCGSRMLLIVDDEPKLLDLLRRYLGRLGYQVETCGDARERAGPVSSGTGPLLHGHHRSFASRYERRGIDRTDAPDPPRSSRHHYQRISLPAAGRRHRISAKTFPPADAGGGGREQRSKDQPKASSARTDPGVWHIPEATGRHRCFLWRAPLACAAKVENCCLRCSWPQDGQCTPLAPLRTSFSNLLPQSSHRYSKIGIGHSTNLHSTSVNAILSTQARTSAWGAEKLLTRIEKASRPRVLLSA